VSLVTLVVLVALAARPGIGLPAGHASLAAAASASPSGSEIGPPPAPSELTAALPIPSVSPTPSATPYPPLAAGIVPMLYLHRVEAVPPEWGSWSLPHQRRFLAYDVLPDNFAADLDWLVANGYTTILPRDLAAHWDNGTPLPLRPVIISLDDGFPSWIKTVLPMLQSRHMVAEFYLTLDAISSFSVTWNQMRRLAAAGMGIGAHDVHHVELAQRGPGLPPASAAEMWFEVNQARLTIGRQLGRLPDSMAYVGGGYNAQLVALVKRAGYTTARSVEGGVSQDRADRYVLRVVALSACDDVSNVVTEPLTPGLPVFAARMSGAHVPSPICHGLGRPPPSNLRES